MSRAARIIAIASKYIGKLEKKGNKGFYDPEFEKLLKAVGFYVGAPWCAFFGKAVWKQVYADHKGMSAVINSCFTGGCLDTLRRVEANGTLLTGEEPRPGAVVIWRHGRGTSGHFGIVESVDAKNNTMTTIEGNTNASGSREGDRVARKLRTINRQFREDGLNIEGFIYPFEL